MSTPPVRSREEHTLLFLGGLHRSGTTPLALVLGDHPAISPLRGTGQKKNEGQHLQQVYPAAIELGGPGRFAADAAAHLTEESPLATPESATALWEAWTPYWHHRPILLEKSPPNLLRTRFLAHLFPGSRQLVILRHPVVVAFATSKWVDGESPVTLVEHWLRAHEVMRDDVARLDSAAVITYEALVRRPEETLGRVSRWLGLRGAAPSARLDEDRSASYAETWRAMATSRDPADREMRVEVLARFSERAAAFGYDLDDLEHEGDHGLPAP